MTYQHPSAAFGPDDEILILDDHDDDRVDDEEDVPGSALDPETARDDAC